MKPASTIMTLAALVAASFSVGLYALAQQPSKPQSEPAKTAPAAAPAAPPAAPALRKEAVPRPADIDRNGVLTLIRTTMLALDQANKTGNYTVLRDLGAPGFQAANTPARLGEIFAWQRRDKLDLSGVASLDPQLTILPQIEPNGLMRMAGFFPSAPSQIKFEMLFAPAGSRWQLFGLGVTLDKTMAGPKDAPPR